MSIFGNLFSGQRAAKAAAPSPAPAPTGDDGAGDKNKAPTVDSQLAELGEVWKIDPAKAPAPSQQPGYFANVDPKKIAAAVGQMDFTGAISPELMERVKAGDTSALSEMLNNNSRATMQAMLTTIPGIMAPVLQQAEQRAAEAATAATKRNRLGEASTGNPVLDSPAFKPMLDAMKQVHAANNPQLSPEQVTQVVVEKFGKMMDVYKAAAESPKGGDASGAGSKTANAGGQFDFLLGN